MLVSLFSQIHSQGTEKKGSERTHVKILRGFHNHAPRDGVMQVELLMGVVEEADGVCQGGEWEEGGIAQTSSWRTS